MENKMANITGDSFKNSQGEVTIKFDKEQGKIFVGGHQHNGLFIHPEREGDSLSGEASIRLQGNIASVLLGAHGENGHLFLFNSDITGDIGTYPSQLSTIHLNAEKGDIILGGNGKHGGIELKTRTGTTTIHLDANTGDITLAGADCAEYFSVAEPQTVSPGTVLIAESEDVLIPSQNPYDKRVVGVVSGAGNYKPGILLGKGLKERGLPVALSGKVYCNVDTSNGAINVGDLLTTSSILGHAMKADDPNKSFGAIIGKALKPLPEGKGLIPILVALQ